MVARRVYLDNVRAMRAANGNEMFVDADGWESVWNGLDDPLLLEKADRLCPQRQLDAFCKAHPELALLLEQIVLEGWTVEEAADALGRTSAAAREFLSQCRKCSTG